MIFDWENKSIQVKIVYYGPAMSGKTTSLKYLFSYFGKLKELDSIESTVGRTLLFDFGVLEFKGSQWGLKFLLYSATGQDFYASTRPATLNGVDGIIFVADSQFEYLERNLRSWNELKTLFGLEIYNLPLVIALNKCDIEYEKRLEKTKLMEYIEFEKYKFLSIINTIAINGKGIMDSFKEIIGFLFPQLTINMNPII